MVSSTDDAVEGRGLAATDTLSVCEVAGVRMGCGEVPAVEYMSVSL